jgi:hypothetical protein
MNRLTEELADRFASLALAHVGREYPNKMDHVMTGPEDVISPRQAHPVFFGSFDWHSCVHGYWLMVHALRCFPDLRSGPEIRTLLVTTMTSENVAIETAYLDRPAARTFERPYGWAWILALQCELEAIPDMYQVASRLRPLSQAFARRFHAFLPLCDYPVRTGVHTSTAFAIRIAADWAQTSDPQLFEMMRQKSLSWYGRDRDCQAWEPSQDDFLSPALMEAECMRRMLTPVDFAEWLGGFLPDLASGQPSCLFAPPYVSDRSDGKIAHLDGLNFSRAWIWRSLARQMADAPWAGLAMEAADRHLRASLPHISGDYMGEHWLATFAMLALEA